VRAADREFEQLTAEEQEEQRANVLYQAGRGNAVRANLGALASRPAEYLSMLAYALRLGGFRYLLYFAEAAVSVE
jgi:hypothetical protein